MTPWIPTWLTTTPASRTGGACTDHPMTNRYDYELRIISLVNSLNMKFPMQTLSKISYTGYLVYAGCFAATLSSAIASLVGAPRVLQVWRKKTFFSRNYWSISQFQALGKDRLYPHMHFFAKGYGANKDPLRGYVLVFFVALAMTMVGNLDSVSTLLSNFFVAAYALVNFSVFHATVTKQPGWRPSFKVT